MDRLPPHQEQIIQTHAALIVTVARMVHTESRPPELDHTLRAAEANGWVRLVGAIRRILDGERDLARLGAGLDDEDRVIVEAILHGIRDPATLPDPTRQADAGAAAPGLAQMIHAARSGQPQALAALGNLAEQMTAAGGDMARLGGIMKRLVDGERDIDLLGKGFGALGRTLLVSIIEELGRLESH